MCVQIGRRSLYAWEVAVHWIDVWNLIWEGRRNIEPASGKDGGRQAIYSHHLGTAPLMMGKATEESHVKEIRISGKTPNPAALSVDVLTDLCLTTGMGETMDLPICSQMIQIYLSSPWHVVTLHKQGLTGQQVRNRVTLSHWVITVC